MSLTVLEHSLAGHLLTRLRDRETPPESFRVLTRALTQLLVLEGTRDLPTRPYNVTSPLEEVIGVTLNGGLVAVPVLRAGLGMLEAVLEMLPEATVGYVGLERNEQTAVASS